MAVSKVRFDEESSIVEVDLSTGKTLRFKEPGVAKLTRLGSLIDDSSNEMDATFALGLISLQDKPVGLTLDDFLDEFPEVVDLERYAEAMKCFPNIERRFGELSTFGDSGDK